jgi:hypothetical protein
MLTHFALRYRYFAILAEHHPFLFFFVPEWFFNPLLYLLPAFPIALTHFK